VEIKGRGRRQVITPCAVVVVVVVVCFFFFSLSFFPLGIVNGEDESKLLQDASRDIGFVLIRTYVASSACFPSLQSHRCPVVSRQRLP
jgi:hypothetical protein